MTRKLFWEDAYQQSFAATVTQASGTQLILDQTTFHPRGGGLVGDTGTLNDLRVIDTAKGEGDTIIHIVEREVAVQAGEQVRGQLDWPRRHRIMRMHTAAHLLSAIFYREAHALITGNQIDPQQSRIDFSLADFDRDRMLGYCAQANGAIRANASVRTYFLPRSEALKIPDLIKLAEATPPSVETLRIVEIEGIDRQADGGVHVRGLGEIGCIEPVRFENKGKTNRRLYYMVEGTA